MADTKHFRDWEPEDELILAQQEVRRLNKLFLATDEAGKDALWPELSKANAELHKWEMKMDAITAAKTK